MIGLLAAGGVGYVLLVVVVFVGYLDRRMNLAPDLRQLLELSQSTSEEDQREWAGIEVMEAVARNEPLLASKRQMSTIAMALWAADVLLLAASAVVVIV